MNSKSDQENDNKYSQEKSAEYIDFEDLENFESEKHYLTSLNNIAIFLKNDKSDWSDQFDSLNDLRRLNKFFPRSFLESLLEISKDFHKFLLSLRSNVAKLSLIVIKEFFGSEIYFSKNPEVLKDYKIENTANIIQTLFDNFLKLGLVICKHYCFDLIYSKYSYYLLYLPMGLFYHSETSYF